MATQRHREIERSFDVDLRTPLPPLHGEDGVVSVGQAVELALEATYFDTADLALARGGVSVRALVRDRPLVPVVRVTTRRLEHALRDEAGAVLALVCDDQVRAEQLLTADQQLEWREWEVELVGGDEVLLEKIEERLRGAGAEPTAFASKLAHALAGRLPPPRRKPSVKSLRRGTAAVVVRAHLTEHIAKLHRQDARVRVGESGSIHKMRIEARRLRTALKTCRPLFPDGATDTLDDDLRWLGRALSDARDAQVLRERLRELVSHHPPELVMGP